MNQLQRSPFSKRNLRRKLVSQDAVSPPINKDHYLSQKFFDPNYSKVNLPLVHKFTKVMGKGNTLQIPQKNIRCWRCKHYKILQNVQQMTSTNNKGLVAYILRFSICGAKCPASYLYWCKNKRSGRNITTLLGRVASKAFIEIRETCYLKFGAHSQKLFCL